jgi:flagellar protein FliS
VRKETVQYPDTQEAIRTYAQVDVHGNAAYASPHRLIQMLLENISNKVAAAKNCMLPGGGVDNVMQKCEHIGRALALVEGLRLSLDKQNGGDIARNLEDLYDYMERRLVLANAKNDPAILDEVASLLNEIKSGWNAIADQAVNSSAAAGHPSVTDAPIVG